MKKEIFTGYYGKNSVIRIFGFQRLAARAFRACQAGRASAEMGGRNRTEPTGGNGRLKHPLNRFVKRLDTFGSNRVPKSPKCRFKKPSLVSRILSPPIYIISLILYNNVSFRRIGRSTERGKGPSASKREFLFLYVWRQSCVVFLRGGYLPLALALAVCRGWHKGDGRDEKKDPYLTVARWESYRG